MCGSLVHVIDEETRLAMDNLVANAANVAANHCPTLPHRLRDRKSKPFAERLLQHHGSAALQGID